MEKIELLKNNNVDVDGALQMWGDLQSYNENLLEFKNTLSTKITNLETYKNNKDWENYAILAHSIKSELKYLGFMKNSEVFLNHELKGKEKDEEYIISNFENLKITANSIYNLLNNYFTQNKKKIIVADDSNIVVNFIKKSLNDKFEIIEASNGEEVINRLGNQNVFALLLDLNMPGSNGFQVLEYMKENKLFETTKVAIITGDDTEETIQKAFTYPIIDVLNKPFTNENIERIINSIENNNKQSE